jgi:hypothetical protein
MGFLGLTHERELELDISREAFRRGLERNIGEQSIGSFLTGMISTKEPEHKYNGTVDSNSFSLTFPKSLHRPSLFYPTITGNFDETKTGLKVNFRVTSLNWIAKALIFQLILATLFIIVVITGVANDLTDVIVISTMFLIVFIPISGIELYRMNKGARTAITEIERDIWSIETTYNRR